MFDRFSRGWNLVQQSWGVLKQEKSLMLFPIFSGIACLLVMAAFTIPFFVAPDAVTSWLEQTADQEQQDPVNQAIGVGVLFLFYFANYFVIVFFNSALVACAIQRYKGLDPKLGDGFSAAVSCLPQILAWAAVAATVGVILRLLEERFDAVGRFVIGLLGIAWSIATYLVVPVIAVEKVGPISALRRSGQLVKQTWGESLAGHFSMGLIQFVISIPGILLLVGGVFLAASMESLVLPITLIGLGVLYLLSLSIVFTTLQQVFLAGLYIFTAEGTVPNGFTEESLRSTFRSRT